jgi:MazG family protein
MATLVALGPGDPDLVPLAAWRALEAAGPVAVPDDEPLAGWLGGHGIALDPGAPVAAASGERFRRLLAERDWDEVVPTGDALRDVLLSDAMLGLQRLTERLRVDCPWDREQTAATIVPHTVEEAYEVAEAVAAGDAAKLVDELGDLLFQAFFLALLCREQGTGDLPEVAAGITDKLVRRHPHFFGEREAETAGAVRRNWEQIKREDEGRAGIFHDVPSVLPGLLHARKVQRRAAAVGFDWDAWDGAWPQLESELTELRAALDAAPPPRPEHEPDAHVVAETGDLLFAAVNVARLANVDPELALRGAAARFRTRVEEAERLAAAAGEAWTDLDLDAQDAWYRRAKEGLRRVQ